MVLMCAAGSRPGTGRWAEDLSKGSMRMEGWCFCQSGPYMESCILHLSHCSSLVHFECPCFRSRGDTAKPSDAEASSAQMLTLLLVSSSFLCGTAVQGKPLSPVKEEREEEDRTTIIVVSRTCRLRLVALQDLLCMVGWHKPKAQTKAE